MSDLLTPRRLIETMIAVSAELDKAQAELVTRAREAASAVNEFKKARASAYLASSGTVGEREAHVDQSTGTLRYQAHLAEGLEKAALEAVRNKRAQLSALQSISAAVKAEAELLKYGPGAA